MDLESFDFDSDIKSRYDFNDYSRMPKLLEYKKND